MYETRLNEFLPVAAQEITSVDDEASTSTGEIAIRYPPYIDVFPCHDDLYSTAAFLLAEGIQYSTKGKPEARVLPREGDKI